MLVIDTNIFLELFLDRKEADKCEEFLKRVSRGQLEAIVSKFVVHAVEALLPNQQLILAFLSNLSESLGLTIYETTLEDEMEAASLIKTKGLDFDDALQYFVARKFNAEAIVSYDHHFDKLDVKMMEPFSLIHGK